MGRANSTVQILAAKIRLLGFVKIINCFCPKLKF